MPPLSIASLTAFLRENGFKISQEDLNIKVQKDFLKKDLLEWIKPFIKKDAEKMFFGNDDEIEEKVDYLVKKVDCKGYDVVGLSGFDSTSISTHIFQMAKKIKEGTGATIVLGGPEIGDYVANVVNKVNFIDHVILGEGQIPFLELVKNIENGKKVPKVIKNSNVKSVIPKPDFKGLDLDLYRKLSSYKELILPYQFTRGCTYHCVLCTCPSQTIFNFKQSQIVAQELEELKKEYKTRFFFFLNNLLNFSNEYVKSFCKHLKERDLDIFWSDSCRPDKLSKKDFINLREVGCIRLVFGLESGSQRILDAMNKSLRVETARQVIKNASEAGIWSTANLVAGFPSESMKDIRISEKFIANGEGSIDEVCVFKFCLFGSAKMFNFTKNFNISKSRKYLYPMYDIYSFSMKNGSSWRIVQNHINYSWKRLRNFCTTLGIPLNIPSDMLYHAYDRLDSKEEVKCWVNKERTNFSNINLLKRALYRIAEKFYYITPLI